MGIRPVKNWAVGYWYGLSGARCRLAYGPADGTATRCLLLSKIQIGFTFLVPAHLGSPGQRAIKRVCLCVCVLFRQACRQYSLCFSVLTGFIVATAFNSWRINGYLILCYVSFVVSDKIQLLPGDTRNISAETNWSWWEPRIHHYFHGPGMCCVFLWHWIIH